MKTKKQIANRKTIAVYFKTNEETTHRILSNLNWGFFETHFGADANKFWDEAHPFIYPSHPSKNYFLVSIEFIKKHFILFSTNQFCTSAGWEYNTTTNKMEWTYKKEYKKIAL